MGTTAKAGFVIVLVILVVAAAYLALMLGPLVGAGSTSSSSSPAATSSTSGGNQTTGLISLFGTFSQMQIHVIYLDNSEMKNNIVGENKFSYVVLGKATLNSVQYTKVRFSDSIVGDAVIAWFNPQANVDRADVAGDKNYTGPSATIYSQKYISALSVVTSLSSNTTPPTLAKVSQNTTSIGPTKAVVTTYQLPAPTPTFLNFTVGYAAIQGTNGRFAVYLDEQTNDMMETLFQVTSITK